MRRLLTLALTLTGLTTTMIALPTITPAGAAPRPVAATLQQIPLTGVAAGGRQPAALRAAGVRAPLLESAEMPTRPYSMLGVTWDVDPAVNDVVVHVRSRSGGTWSGWSVAQANDDVPNAGTPETRGTGTSRLRAGTVPIWAGPSDGVQVSVDRVLGAAPKNVKIELIDPGSSPADAQPAAPRASAGAAEPRPDIITRAQWGADESIRRGVPAYNPTVKVGFVHHTVNSNNYTPEQAAGIVRGIYAYHVQSNGWSDIGYNYLVDRYGRAYEGRAGGIDRYVFGAHTGGFNTDSFGVSLIGDFSTATPPPVMIDKLEDILAWKLGSAYRDPLGTATMTSGGGSYTRYPAGTQHTFQVISGHRDAGDTSCPGAVMYAMLPQIRAAVANKLGAGFADPVVSGDTRVPLGTSATVGLRAKALGSTAWTGTVATAGGDVVRSMTGTGGTAAVSWDLTGADGAPARPGTYVLTLAGTQGDSTALPLRQTVSVVAQSSCRGAPLARVRCRGLARGAGG